VEAARTVLEVPASQTYVKQHRRQSGGRQYLRQAGTGAVIEVTESGHRLLVNLADYLDTGLFLDHRQTRALVRADAGGRRFLNLFGYTGAFTVYAAAGGARATTTVDLSAGYLDWARRNMALNGLTGAEHEYVCDDSFAFLERAFLRRGERYDLVVVDPPTFSNSKKLGRDFDVDRDHVRLLEMVLQVLADGGKVYFSTNCRRFRFRDSELCGVQVREITAQTVPPDFQRRRPHRCWTLVR
jgi:23S rRNA G2069 N7-methylase RlmK/C1962 C5-methylase RlmI